MATNKLEQDLLNLSRELGSDWNKAHSKRYKELAKMAGVPYDEEYIEKPDNCDDYNVAGMIAGDIPKEEKGSE